MNAEEFVLMTKQAVEKSAINEVVQGLEGSVTPAVNKRIAALSDWYRNLEADKKILMQELIKESVQATLFGFFCVLDGVRAIENGPEKGQLQLLYSKANETLLLNDASVDFLHDIYKST